jgi:hypothetical protein
MSHWAVPLTLWLARPSSFAEGRAVDGAARDVQPTGVVRRVSCQGRSVGSGVTGGPSEIHFQRCGGDPVIHLATGWLGRAAEKSALAAKSD